MCASSKGRIKRGPAPKNLKSWNYRERAFDALVRDFSGRCAYSLMHMDEAGGPTGMHIDHFDPNKKKKAQQAYSNLYLAAAACNIAKSSKWPSKTEREQGLRYLDCCREMDYCIGIDPEEGQICEDPATHKLVGTTVAARFHIRNCDLNAQWLVKHRRDRARLREVIEKQPVELIRSGAGEFMDLMSQVRAKLDKMIPPISPPPPE